VSYTIIWEPQATNAAARFLKEDPDGLAAVFHVVDGLAEDPAPPDSSPFGGLFRRLRVGDYRVLYAVEGSTVRILVTNLGRLT
jgi:mRNA interferase RelE/StbE